MRFVILQKWSADKIIQYFNGFADFILSGIINTEILCFLKSRLPLRGGGNEFPFTSGLNQYDFIDYHTFCKLAAECVSQEKINGIINICTGRPEKLSDRAERFIKDQGYHIRLKYGAFPDRPYDSKAVWGDNTKIKRIMEGMKERTDTAGQKNLENMETDR